MYPVWASFLNRKCNAQIWDLKLEKNEITMLFLPKKTRNKKVIYISINTKYKCTIFVYLQAKNN